MCGIIGYIGYDNAKNVLIKGLKSLEYRGYDSAGIAVLKNNKCEITKCKGRVSALEEKVKNIEAHGLALRHRAHTLGYARQGERRKFAPSQIR